MVTRSTHAFSTQVLVGELFIFYFLSSLWRMKNTQIKCFILFINLFYHINIFSIKQERFSSLGTPFFRGAHACVLVIDVCFPKTLENLKKWKDEFFSQAGIIDDTDFPLVLIANKVESGLENERIITEKQIQHWCEGYEWFLLFILFILFSFIYLLIYFVDYYWFLYFILLFSILVVTFILCVSWEKVCV